MTQTQREQILGLISKENLVSYNFEMHVELEYDPGEIWDLFKKVQRSKPVARSSSPPGPDLTPLERIAYMKAFTVAAVEAIDIKFGRLPDDGPGEFQRIYLESIVMRMKRYYEKDLKKRVFTRFPRRPKSAHRCEQFKGYLRYLARMILSTFDSKDHVSWLRKQGINYHEYVKALSKAGVTGTTSSVKISDFANPKAVVEMHARLDVVEEFCSADFYSEQVAFLEDDELFAAKGVIDKSSRGPQFDRIVAQCGIKNPAAMKALYRHFELNLVNEVDPGRLWSIRYFPVEMAKVKNIYNALAHGAVLRPTGKEFLLMQHLLVALLAFKKKTKIADSNNRIFLNNDQMSLITDVVAAGYTIHLDKKKIKTFAAIAVAKRGEGTQVFQILRRYYTDRITRLSKDKRVRSQVPQAFTATRADEDLNADSRLDLTEFFRDQAHFSDFILRLQYSLSGHDPFCSSSDLAATLKSLSTDRLVIFLTQFLKTLGYRIIESPRGTDTIYFEGSIGNITDQRVLASKRSFQVVKRDLVISEKNLNTPELKDLAVDERKAGIRRTSVLSLASEGFTQEMLDVAKKMWIELKTLDTFAETVMKSLGALTPEEQGGLREGITKMLLED